MSKRPSRLSRWRQEVAQLFNVTTDKTGPMTFIPDLASDDYTSRENWRNLLKVAWEDPVANRICVLLSIDALDDWFVLKKMEADDKGERETHDDNEQIQEEFLRMDAKKYITRALIGERIFGQSALVLNQTAWNDEMGVPEEGYQVATLDVFTNENSIIDGKDWDDMGNPIALTCYYNAVDMKKYKKVPFDDIIWFCTRPIGRSWFGYPAMHSTWDDLTYLRNAKHNLGWLYQKQGLGWMVFYNRAVTDEDLEAQANMLQEMSASRAMTIDINRTEKVEWEGPPAGAHVGVVEGIDMFLGQVSSGTGIPKDIFTGTSAGAITGSEINNKALYATISKIQSDIEPYLQELIYRMGYEDEYYIEWNTRYATDELEQAQIRYLNAQAESMEQMAKRGMGPNDISVGYRDQDKTNNPAGVTGKG